MRVKRNMLAIWVAAWATMVLVGPANAQLDVLRKLGRSDTKPVPAKKVACFKIKGVVTETPVNVPPLFGGEQPKPLKEILEQFKEARLDNDVLAIVVDIQGARLGFAQLEELHEAMSKFRAVDKDVYMHADFLTNRMYALATGASHVSVVPTGEIWLTGIYGESPYLRGTLDKIGAFADFEQCGAYKSAAETLTRTGPSDEAREMKNWLFGSIYDRFVELIAKSKGMSPEKTREIIDNGPYTADEALEAGLIDSVKHRQDFVAGLESRYGDTAEFVTDYGEGEDDDIPQDMFSAFRLLMKILSPSPEEYTEPSVAIVYVDGAIMPGEPERSPFGPQEGAFSTTIRRALDKAADDDSVKAVVLRVDSPGGSALASEIILDAAERVRAKKPLVVSMGNVAGSGGYYVACMADAIFASAGTITASIGVISGKLVTTGMWDKLGVSWDPIQYGKMAAMMSSATPFSEAERAKRRHYMTTVYDIFKDHVVKGRGKKLAKPIDEMAGGRVYTGAQALELGLVDKLGGLDDAIKFAADKANLAEYEIRVIPEPPSIFDMFMGTSDDDEFTRMSTYPALGIHEWPMFRAALPMLAKVDPLRARAIVRALQRIELVHAEGAITMMPEEYLIR
ncbi:MAG: signal peptide peptidase SppA [Planctomycetota bacterium]|jgi:protease-4